MCFYLFFKPTDVPQHVIDEKKNNITSNKQKTESSNQSDQSNVSNTSQQKQEQQKQQEQEKQQEIKTEKENNKNSAIAATGSGTEKTGKVAAVEQKNKNRKSPQTSRRAIVLSKTKCKFLIPPAQAITMTPEQKQRKLKELVCEAFSTAHARNLRALNNKWLRWKYVDELREKERQWMESQKLGGDMGWAVGRRIYEKEEIEVNSF